MEFEQQLLNINKNIINWYEFKANSKIINLSNSFSFDVQNSTIDTKVNDKQKYDYAVVIGIESIEEAKEKLDLCNSIIKDDGIILFAFDNKFGIKYFSGVSDEKELYSSITSSRLFSLNAFKRLLSDYNFEYKVYYPLPDYKITNVIYSDEFMPNRESIISRDLVILKDNEYQEFSQRNALIQLLENDKEQFKLFCNSYFVEISKKPILNTVRYVNFEVYRKNEYNIKTIMRTDYVSKSANCDLAQSHIKNIIKNIELLKKYGIDTLDTYENSVIRSKLAPKEAVSLDKKVLELAKNNKQDAIELLNRFRKEVIEKLPLLENQPIGSNVFTKYDVVVPKKIMEKFHFVKDGLVDLIIQNVFYFDDKFYVYDQEWYEEDCPIEFILFRNIFYNHELAEYIPKEEQYKKFNIEDCIDKFLELENNIQSSIRNEVVWQKHIDTVNKTGLRTVKYEFMKNQIEKMEDELDEYFYEKREFDSKIEKIQNDLDKEKERSKTLESQLHVIEKSLSWKITGPLRYISWVLNFKNKVTFRDRFFPPGSNSRKRFDKMFPPKQPIILGDYDYWMENNNPTQEDLEKQRNTKFDFEPKISILTPLYNTNPVFFKELLDSLQKQTYSNWELCLADGSPKELKKIQKLIKKENRCKYVFLNENKGISENTNEALKLATGDYIGLLDHDDYLSDDCLYEVVKCINDNKNLKFVYTDEDKSFGPDSRRFDPYFKNDFAPDTLNSQNYICHFSVFKKSVMDQLKGFDKTFDGAQDYDIFLRMSEIVKPENIYHIPKICYHWRVSESSTAGGEGAKPWAFEAGQKAIEAHLKRLNQDAVVKSGIASGTYEVEYKVIGNPKVNLIIPNKDSIDILKVLVDSILKVTTYDNYEIDIIENNSTDEKTFEFYKKLERNDKVRIIRYPNKGFNYSKIINYGVKHTEGDFVMQLNNDTEIITPDWLDKMVGYCQQKHVGAVGAKLLYPDYTVQHAGVLLGLGGIAGHYYKFLDEDDIGYFAKPVTIQDMSAVTAACIMTKRDIYEKVGYMNEALAVAFNDIDFCMKIRKQGLLIVYNPYVKLLHYESKSRGEENSPEKVARFNSEIEKFKDYWQEELDKGDPYYNKNLRLDNDRYAIRTEKVD